MIDVHCHLNFHAFEKDYDGVIRKAVADGVEKIINVGTSIESSQKAIELAQKYENLYAIVGIHPHHADKVSREAGSRSAGQSDFVNELEELAKQKKVVAIGEIGMDYYSYKSNAIVDPKVQREVFIKQIELAIKLSLPLQIHNRLAGIDILEVIKHYKNELLSPPGMFHCMSGDIEHLKRVLDLGFYVGFDGNITYEGIAKGETTELSELVKYTPIDRIVAETDSPYLSPEPYRGMRNIPSYVILVGKFLAKIKAISFEETEEITSQNAKKIFHLE